MRALRFLSAALPLAGLLLAPAPVHAATLKVPADFPTIQAAINAASPGDTRQTGRAATSSIPCRRGPIRSP